jgi:hypothetical protein
MNRRKCMLYQTNVNVLHDWQSKGEPTTNNLEYDVSTHRRRQYAIKRQRTTSVIVNCFNSKMAYHIFRNHRRKQPCSNNLDSSLTSQYVHYDINDMCITICHQACLQPLSNWTNRAMLGYPSRTSWTDRTAPEWHGTAVLDRLYRFHCTRWGRRNRAKSLKSVVCCTSVRLCNGS